MNLSAWIVVAVAAAGTAWLALAYAAMEGGRRAVADAWARISVQLKRRHDLVAELAESARGYMPREQETFARLVDSRALAIVAETPAAAIAAENRLSAALARLAAAMEGDARLKADPMVVRLVGDLAATEGRIDSLRGLYNDHVLAQRRRIDAFPTRLLSRALGFAPCDHFDAPGLETTLALR